MKPLLIVVRRAQAWEEAIKRAEEAVSSGRKVEILFLDEGVTRCPRCEPALFRHLHQLFLDGAKLFVCERSLSAYGIPKERPPEVFSRLSDGEGYLREFAGEVLEI